MRGLFCELRLLSRSRLEAVVLRLREDIRVIDTDHVLIQAPLNLAVPAGIVLPAGMARADQRHEQHVEASVQRDLTNAPPAMLPGIGRLEFPTGT